MKEIIKRIFIGVIAVVVVIGGAIHILKEDDDVVVDVSTTSGAVITDVNGQTTTAAPQQQVNGETQNTVNGTTGSASVQNTTNSYQETPGVQNTTGAQNAPGSDNSQTNNTTTQNTYTPGVTGSQNQQPVTQGQQIPQTSQPQQGNAVTPTQNAGQTQQVNRVDAYQNIFKSGRFMMKINDPDLGPVLMAMSGNKMLVEASMEGITLKMMYDGDKTDEENPNGTWFIIIDSIKKYSPISAELVGDMNVKELTKEFANEANNTNYTKSTEVVNGEELYCESCVDGNGNTTKYYFKGDQLVRSDSISPSGAVSTTEFQEISGNVDESLFAIPDNYNKWDISWLMEMMG